VHNVSATVDPGPYNLHKVARLRATKIWTQLAEAAAESSTTEHCTTN
jgi:hypothetical protein